MIQVYPKLIGICGHAHSGKDTIASYLHKTRSNTWTEPFAAHLKAAASVMFGIPIDNFNDNEYKEIPDDYWKVSPRQIAQFFGTEMVRNNISALLPGIAHHFWVYRMEAVLSNQLGDVEYDTNDVVVIPDVRFQNEYDWVLAQDGIIIHLTRTGADGTVGIHGHESEHGIGFPHTPERNYYLENNGRLDDLYAITNGIVSAAKIYPLNHTNPDSY